MHGMEMPVYPSIVAGGAGFLTPAISRTCGRGVPPERRERWRPRSLRYTPTRAAAPGPRALPSLCFGQRESNRAIMDHFLESSWLWWASELDHGASPGEAAHVRQESIGVERLGDGSVLIERGCGRRRRRRDVRRVLARWREVRGWWQGYGGEDLLLYRLLLSDGAVVDVGRDRRSGRWALIGVID